MRPVARIAQSVEQGIENPCVLGSIPSPGTIFKETSLMAGFLLSGVCNPKTPLKIPLEQRRINVYFNYDNFSRS